VIGRARRNATHAGIAQDIGVHLAGIGVVFHDQDHSGPSRRRRGRSAYYPPLPANGANVGIDARVGHKVARFGADVNWVPDPR
jgi:hypothetical protein